MKNLLLPIWVFAFLLLFTSCLEIREDIYFNKNGSGTVKTVIDMQEIMGLAALFLPDSSKQQMMNFDSLLNAPSQLESIPGISNIQNIQEDDFVISISYDFANPKALQQALGSASKNMDENTEKATSNNLLNAGTNYTVKKRKIRRESILSQDSDNTLQELMSSDDAETKEMLDMFSKPLYKITYHLPRKVKKITTEGGATEVKKDGNTVSLSYDLVELSAKKGKVFDHMIKF